MPNIVRPGRIPLPGQSATGFKPNPWNVQRRYIAPEWRWAWDDLVFAVPFWEGGGSAFDVFTGLEGSLSPGSGTAQWRVGGLGHEVDTSGSGGASVVLTVPSSDKYTSVRPATMLSLVVPDSDPDDFDGLVYTRASGPAAQGILKQSDASSDWLAYSWDDEANEYEFSSGINTGWTTGTYYLCVVVVKNGPAELYRYNYNTNTLEEATNTEANTGGHSTQDITGDWNINLDPFHDSRSFPGANSLSAVWTRAFSRDEVLSLARDPFGPFRPAQQVIVSSPTGATTVIVGQAVETDTAQSVGSAKSQSVGQSTESDTSQSVTADRAHSVGQSTETDSAFSVTAAKTVSVGQSTETDAAQAVTAAKAQAVGLATETDASLAAGAAKAQSVGLSTETDSALAVTVQVGNTISVGQATETDTAQAVSSAKSQSVGQASESDLALSVTPVRVLTLGQASEVDTAQAVDIARTVAAGLAVETDQSLAVQVAKLQTVGQATETDTSLAVTIAGAPLTLSGPFTMFGESLERTMTGEALTRTMNSEDAERTMSGEE